MSFKRMLILLVAVGMVVFSTIMLHAGNLEEQEEKAKIPEIATATILLPDRPLLASAMPIFVFEDFGEELEKVKEEAEQTAIEEAEKKALKEAEKESEKQEETKKPEEKPQKEPEEENEVENEKTEKEFKWDGEVLNASNGIVEGPSGKESYYNLDMSGIIKEMRWLGYSEEEYPYSIREDGVKMLGDYVMCAANLKIRPKGTLVDTTLGKAIVCDTGSFAKKNPTQLDIAVNW